MTYSGILVSNELFPTCYLRASSHLVGAYYAGNLRPPIGDQTDADYATTPQMTLMGVPGSRAGVFPDFSPAMSDGYSTIGDSYGKIHIPYASALGAVYVDDERVYMYGRAAGVGVGSIRRYSNAFTPPWSTGYTPPTGVAVGESSMLRLKWFETNMFDEDYGVGVDENGEYAWFSSNLTLTPTWTSIHRPVIIPAGDIVGILNHAMVPSLKNTVFFCGREVNTGLGTVFHTINMGATLVNDNSSGAGRFSTIMALVAGDMINSQIRIDWHYTGNLLTATGDGVDVSRYQGTMNWATALAAGITFAFIKSSQGTSSTDPNFSSNWSGAGAQGISRGPYHYYMNSLDPTAQANHFVSTATSGGELGYAVDCEDESASLDPANLKTFLDRMEALTGQKCIIYTRASWWNSYVGFQGWASDYPLWVANWNAAVPTLPDGWSAWAFWQITSQGNGSTYGAQSAFIDLDKQLGA